MIYNDGVMGKTGWMVVIFCIAILTPRCLIPARAATAPSEVWVSAAYNAGEAGWGETRFASVRAGVDAAAQGGAVNVGAGVYRENVVIEKSLSLLGAGVGAAAIDGRDGGHAVLVRQTSGVAISGFTFDAMGNWSDWAVLVDGSEDVVVADNHVLDNGIGLVTAHRVQVKNNLIGGKGSIFLSHAWENRVEGNTLDGGDWIVTGEEDAQNQSIRLSGDLIVENGSRLTLQNVDLEIVSTGDMVHGISVRPGGSLSILNSRVFSISNAGFTHSRYQSERSGRFNNRLGEFGR
ncbi:MAG: hypothetical protein GY859_24975, partial [Desulfobacterales bacterium]|nr:hypothetical protein [Desulfobacterales bacterium]